MNHNQATEQVRAMLDDQFYHQANKLHLEIDRDFLTEIIVKQMEHAFELGKLSGLTDNK